MPRIQTGDGSLTLHSDRYGQTFHSLHGAATEAQHVFLSGSGVAERLAAGNACRVLEVGFGTGLNFWLTADAAVQSGSALEFVTLEQELLEAQALRPLMHTDHLQHPELLERYLGFRDSLPAVVPPGHYSFEPAPGIMLRLLIGEALDQGLPEEVHAVYHDAFSPDANPELWTEAFLGKLVSALTPGGTLATYSVKGEIRRRLQQLGLDVHKRPGPASGKREMLVAYKPEKAR